jgi:hypothetical protein
MHFGVWWKIATAAEASSYTFTWNRGEQAYGWIMRFTGHDPASPIHKFAVGEGYSSWALTAPAVTTTIGYTMILRLVGIDNNNVYVDSSEMIGYTTITMDGSGNGKATASGGAAYVLQSSDGDSGTADFEIKQDEEYRTVTIAIAPDPY